MRRAVTTSLVASDQPCGRTRGGGLETSFQGGQLALAVALVLAVTGFALCALPGRGWRLLGGGAMLGGLALFAFAWSSSELPKVRASWSPLVADLAVGARRLLRTAELADLVFLGGLVAIGLWLRLVYLGQPMRYDEAFTLLNFGSPPLWVGLSSYQAPNNHLLHTLLLHFSQSWLGTAPWAIRLPAFVAGVLMIPAEYFAIRELIGRRAGLLAAALVASSAVLVEYSTNARGYTLQALITILLVGLAASLSKRWNATVLCFFGVLAALGFYTIPTMLYAWGAIVLWLALAILAGPDVCRRERLRDLSRCIVLTGVVSLSLYAPVLVRDGSESITGNAFVTPLAWADFVHGWPVSLTRLWREWNLFLPVGVQVVLAAAFGASLAVCRGRMRTLLPLPLAAALWIIPIVVFQRVVPFERVWLFLLPIYLGFAAGGFVWLVTPIVGQFRSLAWLPVGLASISLAWLLSLQVVKSWSVPSSDLEAAATFLAGYLGRDDRVVVQLPVDWPLRYYFGRQGLPSDMLVSRVEPGELGAAAKPFGRLLAVVDEQEGQTLLGVITSTGMPGGQLPMARVLQRLASVTVYELNDGDARLDRAEPAGV